VFDIKTMQERLTESLAPQGFHLVLIGIFTLIAVVLSAVGVYGVMSYVVAQRHREIGIRIAMGAGLEHVFRLVLGESVTLAMLAVVVGLVGARALRGFLHSMLYGVTAVDALTFTIMPLVLLAIAIAASFVPAMKALRIDPTVALREERAPLLVLHPSLCLSVEQM
jgi:ABC-type antimicrobial peptide transport system permease subunit